MIPREYVTELPGWSTKAQNLKTAASRLRDLANEKATSIPEMKGAASSAKQRLDFDYNAQTAWLQKAAGRCETLAQQMDEAAGKGWIDDKRQPAGGAPKGELTPNLDQPDMKKLDHSFSNLRKALLSESASNARQTPETIKARRDKAAGVIQALK